VGDVDEGSAKIFPQPLEFGGALPRSARRPGFQAQKDDDNDYRNSEPDQR